MKLEIIYPIQNNPGHLPHLARISSNDAVMSTPSNSRPLHRHAATCRWCPCGENTELHHRVC